MEGSNHSLIYGTIVPFVGKDDSTRYENISRRKQLMRNLKGKTGRTEKTKISLSTDTHKMEKMPGEQGIYFYKHNSVGRENLLPLKI